MRTAFTMLACLAFVLLIPATPTHADDGRPAPTIIPAKLTGEQRAANERKVALARQRYADVLAHRVVHKGDPSAYANIYMEPQSGYAPNWCGAGAATVLIAGWQIKRNGADTIWNYSRYSNPDGTPRWFSGGEAYMQHLAYDGAVVQDSATGLGITEPSANRNRDYSDETHVANGANNETATLRTGGFYYAVWQNMGTVTNLRTVLNDDIATFQVPFAQVAKPCPSGSPCLSGWNSAPTSMNHWQTTGAYDTGTDQLIYGDSASTAQAYGGDPWYWHSWGIVDYFNTYMTPYLCGTVVW